MSRNWTALCTARGDILECWYGNGQKPTTVEELLAAVAEDRAALVNVSAGGNETARALIYCAETDHVKEPKDA